MDGIGGIEAMELGISTGHQAAGTVRAFERLSQAEKVKRLKASGLWKLLKKKPTKKSVARKRKPSH
jgi:Na+-transporting NADH:ubiquinone oxidoreductase subunit NqrA